VDDDFTVPDSEQVVMQEVLESESDTGIILDDGGADPDFDPGHLEDEYVDPDSDPGLLAAELAHDPELDMDETLDEASDDPEFISGGYLECESDFDSVGEPDCVIEVGTVEEVEDENAYQHREGPEQYSDSEEEELEVEWGLTDGESNSSASSEGEVQVRVFDGYADVTDLSSNQCSTSITSYLNSLCPRLSQQ
jgi:hypothetical protein